MRGHHHSNIAQGRGEQSAALGAERDCLPGSTHPPMAGQAEHTGAGLPPPAPAARDPRRVWIARPPPAALGSLPADGRAPLGGGRSRWFHSRAETSCEVLPGHGSEARRLSLLVEPFQESALRAVPVEVRPGQITRRVVRAVDSLLFVVDSPQQIIERVAKRLVRWRQSQTPLFQT